MQLASANLKKFLLYKLRPDQNKSASQWPSPSSDHVYPLDPKIVIKMYRKSLVIADIAMEHGSYLTIFNIAMENFWKICLSIYWWFTC